MPEENKDFEEMKKRAEIATSELEDLKNKMKQETDNSEVERLKRELKEATDKIKDFEARTNSDAEKVRTDELQKLKDELEKANKLIRENETEKEFAKQAAELKANNPQKLLALVKDKIEYDEQDKPKNLKEVLEQAKKDYQEEFGEAKKSETKKEGIDGGKRDESDSKYSDEMSPTERMRAAYADLDSEK